MRQTDAELSWAGSVSSRRRRRRSLRRRLGGGPQAPPARSPVTSPAGEHPGPIHLLRAKLELEAPQTRPLWRDHQGHFRPAWQEARACDVGSTVETSVPMPEPGELRAVGVKMEMTFVQADRETCAFSKLVSSRNLGRYRLNCGTEIGSKFEVPIRTSKFPVPCRKFPVHSKKIPCFIA